MTYLALADTMAVLVNNCPAVDDQRNAGWLVATCHVLQLAISRRAEDADAEQAVGCLAVPEEREEREEPDPEALARMAVVLFGMLRNLDEHDAAGPGLEAAIRALAEEAQRVDPAASNATLAGRCLAALGRPIKRVPGRG